METYKMKCPKCGYTYKYQDSVHEWETCPICGYGAEFDKFVVKE